MKNLFVLFYFFFFFFLFLTGIKFIMNWNKLGYRMAVVSCEGKHGEQQLPSDN